ncbi:MAG TPA: GAF domain-containing protein [Gemmatimonadales bacterium]|jgi:two-component system NtrC family sensor kinase
MSALAAQLSGRSLSLPLPPAHADALAALLDLALQATAATGVALLLPDGSQLRTVLTRGANAPALGERIGLEGSVAGEAWYRGRLVNGTEPAPSGRQDPLRRHDRTVDVLAMPVLTAERPVAVLVLYHPHPGHFRPGDATTLTRMATIVAGLWNRPQRNPPAGPRGELEAHAAARMALLAAGASGEREAWGDVARTAGVLLEAASARVSLLEGEELVCLAGIGRFSGDVGRRHPRTYGFEGEALQSSEGVLAAEWTPESKVAGQPSWMRSLISVPLRRMEQVVGVLSVADEVPGRFTEGDREALVRFAMRATAAVAEVRLTEETQRHLADGRVVNQVAAVLAAAEDTPALRRAVVGGISRALGATGARLSEVIENHPAVTAWEGDSPLLERPLLPGGELLCGHVLAAGEMSHRCALPGGEGFLLAVLLGRVANHPGCLQLLREAESFKPHEELLLRQLAPIAELALASRLTNVRVSQYAERIRSVAEVSATLHQSLRPVDAMSQAAEMLRRALGVDTVRIGMADEARQELIFPIYRHGLEVEDGRRDPMGTGLLEEVWRTGRTYFLPENAAEEARTLGFPLDRASRCVAAVPLRRRSTIAGVVAIEDESRDHAFESEDVRILEIVAQQLGVTLDNLESLEEERRQRITAEWLRQMARTATDPQARPLQVFELAADAAFQGIGGLAALVDFITPDGLRTLVASRGQVPGPLAEPLPLAGTVAGWVVDEDGAVFISANLAEDPRLNSEERERAGPMALVAAPILGETRIIAVLQLARPSGASYAVADVERLAQIADHAGAGYQTAKAGEALRETEERYHRLFSAATDAIFTLDRQGAITSFNQAAERVWAVDAGQVVGRRWDAVLSFDSPDTVAEQIKRVHAGEACEFEVSLRRPDREHEVVVVTISPLLEDGQVRAVLGVAREVTEAVRGQAQLLQTEKMSAISQLLGGMAHEINNPLTSILMNLELLLQEVQNPAQRETLRAIRVQTDRAAEIVRNLLTYLRGQGSERAPVDLREAARGALALRRNQLLSQEIAVVVDLPAQPVLVLGNTVNLQQVLMNLLVNAEHAIRTHRGGGHVWLRLAVQEGHAVVTVEDDGPGIAPELLTRVFDPFYTTKPEGEGTGLGLSVSAGIIADHQGRITAGQRPEGGARFVVELPLWADQPGPGRIGELTPSVPAARSAARGKVLVVDDQPDIRRSVSKFLTRSGWAVDVADSGEEGLRLLGLGDYEVVLCDLRMPGMSGPAFYRHLQDQSSPAIGKLVFMTGDTLSPEASRFLREAGRPVLSKPFALKDLMEVLAQVVPE